MNSGNTIPLFGTSKSFFQTDSSEVLSPGQAYYAGLRLNATRFAGHAQGVSNGSINDINYRVYLTTHLCHLTFGDVEYKVDLNGDKVSLSQSTEDKLLEPVNLTVPTTSSGDGTIIGGFEDVSSLLFKAGATYNFCGAVNSFTLGGTLAHQMLVNASSTLGYPDFADPMDVMLESLRNIAFQAALKAGSDGNDTFTKAVQEVQYTGHRVYSVYRTHYLFMLIAVGLSLLSLLPVFTTMYGWWQLGRKVSTSPLEIAKAFDAPLLRAAGSNTAFKTYPSFLKNQKIRYGARADRRVYEAELEHLVVDLHTRLHQPRNDFRYA